MSVAASPQTVPSLDHRALLELLRAADRCRRHFAQLLAPAGLTLTQYNALRILRGAGEEGLPTLAIAERMLEQTPGVTRLVDRLEARGLVERRRCQRDRRRVYCLATEEALAVLARLDAVVDEGDRQCFRQLSAEEKQAITDLSRRILGADDERITP
jgi:DNA-binding MarR family transcriptional regulator